MSQFAFEKIVHANRNVVFEIFSNFKNYPQLAPQYFPSIRIRSVRDNVAIVEEHLILGEKEFLIMAKHILNNPVLHEIFVIGGDAKGSHIKQEFIELKNATKVLVDVTLKLKGKLKISTMFGRNNFKDDYNKVLDTFVKIAEN